MGKKLADGVNVVVLDEHGDPVVLAGGQDVPAKYADQVGDHCFDTQGADSKPARKPRQSASE